MHTPSGNRRPLSNIKAFNCLLTIWLFSLIPAYARNLVWEHYVHETSTNRIVADIQYEGERPELMAIMVQPSESEPESMEAKKQAFEAWRVQIKTNRTAKPPLAQKMEAERESFTRAAQSVAWIPFQTNVLIDLGPGDGTRTVYFSYRYKGQTTDRGWSGSGVTVTTTPLIITIVNPETQRAPYRILQLQGRSNHELRKVRYEQRDETGTTVRSDDGHPNATYMGDPKFETLRKCFTCFDIELSMGTNSFAMFFEDEFGKTITTNVVVVFSNEGDHEPPQLALQWPHPNTQLSGKHFTARGNGNDPGAIWTGQIVAGGHTNEITGFPERSGFFWFEDIPLALGENQLTLIATDPAGNSSRTNLMLYGVDGPIITMDDVVPPSNLWNAFITATGTVAPANNDVWINGVKAQVKADGTWKALRVPVHSPNGGTAVFEMTTYSPEGMKQGEPKLKELVATQANLGTNAMTLNASSPACGVFQLRLNGTAGRGFVLLSSTNLTDWHPILTNANPQASFDYTDANPDKIPCRFFRVVPLGK